MASVIDLKIETATDAACCWCSLEVVSITMISEAPRSGVSGVPHTVLGDPPGFSVSPVGVKRESLSAVRVCEATVMTIALAHDAWANISRLDELLPTIRSPCPIETSVSKKVTSLPDYSLKLALSISGPDGIAQTVSGAITVTESCGDISGKVCEPMVGRYSMKGAAVPSAAAGLCALV